MNMKRTIKRTAGVILSICMLANTATVNAATVTLSKDPATNAYYNRIRGKHLKRMSTKKFIKVMGPIAQADYQKTGVLASVTLAQAIVESGWGRSRLSVQGNNLFGMKTNLSGNRWKSSTWKGRSVSRRGSRFRAYKSIALCVADHSAYLSNVKRYRGLKKTKSYSRQISIIQRGGYCTGGYYGAMLRRTIRKYHLTRFDKKEAIALKK